MFQGWKVKLYTFVTLLLFFAGATYTMWPHASVTSSKNSNDTAQILTVEGVAMNKRQQVVAVESVDPSTEALDANEGGVYMPETSAVSVDDPVIVKPAPVVEIPAPTPKSYPTPAPSQGTGLSMRPIELPIIKLPPIILCGCVALQKTDKHQCPMNENNNLPENMLCKTEY